MTKTNLYIFIIVFTTSCSAPENKTSESNSDNTKVSAYTAPIEKKDDIDSAKIKELKPFFNISSDKFDPNARVWYQPKSKPKYINSNHLYCYFEIVNNKPANFRLKIQYYDDDWLFIEKYQFLIDGTPIELIPESVEQDNGNGGYIWEWYDHRVTSEANDVWLIQTLAVGKEVKIKFIGRQYHDIKSVPKSQVQSIARTYQLYKAMGGQF